MKKTMEWSDPVIIKLSENRGASGAANCLTGVDFGGGDCPDGWGASSCGSGVVPGASGTMCESGGTATACDSGGGGTTP